MLLIRYIAALLGHEPNSNRHLRDLFCWQTSTRCNNKNIECRSYRLSFGIGASGRWTRCSHKRRICCCAPKVYIMFANMKRPTKLGPLEHHRLSKHGDCALKKPQLLSSFIKRVITWLQNSEITLIRRMGWWFRCSHLEFCLLFLMRPQIGQPRKAMRPPSLCVFILQPQ